MQYQRMPIEVESPEEIGYSAIRHNLAESSMQDQTLASLNIGADLQDLLLCYGDHRGHPGARELLANSVDLDPDAVLLTSGAAGALFMIATTLLGPSDHLVVLRPNYATNIETPRAIGCEITFVDLNYESNWKVDVGEIRAAMRPNTRLVSVTSPHNPTGTMLNWGDLEALAEITKSRGCFLLVDETYRDLSHVVPPESAARLGRHVLAVASLSKAYGLPGLRLGWVICAEPKLMTTLLAAKEQIQICGSILEEEIAFRVLSRREELLVGVRERLLASVNTVQQWIDQDVHFGWVKPSGGAVGFVEMNREIETSRFYDQLFNKHATVVGPGHWFEQPDRFFRLGFGWPSPEELSGGLTALSLAAQASLR